MNHTTIRYQPQLQEQHQEAATAPVAAPPPDPDAFRAAFLADIEKEPVTTAEDPPEAVPEEPVPDDGDPADDGMGDEGDDDDANEPTLPAVLGKLKEAIDAKDPERFIDALGPDAAEALLGAAGHKALRHTAKEIKQAREKLVKAGDELKEKFGDPAAIRAAVARNDADAAVEGCEKFFGASWADIIKFVNASFAGKPARLEAKAAEQRASTERQSAERTAAEAKVRESIKAEVIKGAPTLAAKFPAIEGLVFEKMRQNFSKGVDTPTKALKLVIADLKAQAKALSGAFAEPETPPAASLRPPRETGAKGRPMTAEEFRQDFVSSFGRDERAKSRRGAK